MKAYLESLNGKYRGTNVIVNTPDGGQTSFSIWSNHNGDERSNIPSVRELGTFGITQKQYVNNETIECSDIFGEIENIPAQEVCEQHGDHWESQYSYEIAMFMVHKLNTEFQ